MLSKKEQHESRPYKYLISQLQLIYTLTDQIVAKYITNFALIRHLNIRLITP